MPNNQRYRLYKMKVDIRSALATTMSTLDLGRIYQSQAPFKPPRRCPFHPSPSRRIMIKTLPDAATHSEQGHMRGSIVPAATLKASLWRDLLIHHGGPFFCCCVFMLSLHIKPTKKGNCKGPSEAGHWRHCYFQPQTNPRGGGVEEELGAGRGESLAAV